MFKQKTVKTNDPAKGQKKSISKKIIIHTIILLLVVSVVLVGVMSYYIGRLTNTILLDTLQPIGKIGLAEH
jgi:uncharacterized membrane protein YvbJ